MQKTIEIESVNKKYAFVEKTKQRKYLKKLVEFLERLDDAYMQYKKKREAR